MPGLLPSLANLGRLGTSTVRQVTGIRQDEANKLLGAAVAKAIRDRDPTKLQQLLDNPKIRQNASPEAIEKIQRSMFKIEELRGQDADRTATATHRADLLQSRAADRTAADARAAAGVAGRASEGKLGRDARAEQARLDRDARQAIENARIAGRATFDEADILALARQLRADDLRANPEASLPPLEVYVRRVQANIKALRNPQAAPAAQPRVLTPEEVQQQVQGLKGLPQNEVEDILNESDISEESKAAIRQGLAQGGGVLDSITNFFTDGEGVVGFGKNVFDPLRAIRGPQ